MKVCCVCGKRLGSLDFYADHANGKVCGECLNRFGEPMDSGPAPFKGIRYYHHAEQAYLPLSPASTAQDATPYHGCAAAP